MTEDRVVHELRVAAAEPLARPRATGLALALCVCGWVLAVTTGGVVSHVGAPSKLGLSSAVDDAARVAVGFMVVLAIALFVWSSRANRFRAGRRIPLWQRLVAMATILALSVGAATLLRRAEHRPHQLGAGVGPGGGPAGADTNPKPLASSTASRGHVTWIELAAVGAGIVLGLVALFLFVRAPRGELHESRVAEELEAAAVEGIDDLGTEPDARRAVLKAYARMESALDASGLPRQRSETPFEFLGRALLRLDASRGSVARLTSLFERAKFSHHEVDERMRREAIAALADVRTELAG
jgi:Domain of unknown function (DUF4129)